MCKKKKIKFMPCECRCNKVFCLRHKAREDNQCTFDILGKGAEELSKEIPIVIADRVEQI